MTSRQLDQVETKPTIEISVVIPTFNRYHQLRRALECLAQSNFPRSKFEVIVVDDGGSQPITDLLDTFSQQLNVSLLRQSNQGAAAARNYGTTHARGRFVVFTDDDCMPDAHWLSSLAQALAQYPDCAIGGRTINSLEKNLYAVASQLLIDYLYAFHAIDADRVAFLAGNHLACARSKFDDLGGFDSSFTLSAAEDRDFCLRWITAGNSLRLLNNARLYHAHDLSLPGFVRQHFNYGRGAFNFHLRESQIRTAPIRVAPLNFYLALVRYPFFLSQKNACRLSALLALSQLANAAGFFYQCAINLQLDGKRAAATLPPLSAAAEP